MTTKIKIFGWEHPISVLNDIKQEFVNQNVDVVQSGVVDIIFHTTGFFDEALEYYYNQSPNAVKIFNLLDASPSDPSWDAARAIEQLNKADIRTTISKTARKHIETRTGFTDLEIIGYPMLPTAENLNYTKTIEFLWVGRIAGKRFDLCIETLKQLNVDLNCLVVCGPERPPVGVYVGTMSQDDLNVLYNSTRFCFLTSKYEGIGLSMLEQTVTGGFPIVCNDNECVEEFNLTDFATNPDPVDLALKVNDIYCNQQKYKEIVNKLGPKFREQFSLNTFVKNVLNLYNKYKRKHG